MTARGTDWALAALVAALVASGALTLFAGAPGDAWVFAAHDALGVGIAVALVVKLWRVRSRVLSRDRWDRRTVAGAVATLLAAAALCSGWMWSAGATPSVAGYTLLSWHDVLGVVLALGVACHMALRAKPLRRRDLAHRRQFLLAAGAAAASVVAWRVQRPVETLIGLRGGRRRFTGSYEAGSFAGNAFPSTSWLADRPRPVSPAGYRLRVSGLAARPLVLSIAEIAQLDELTATLDCTGGFYSTQRWRGIRLASLVDRAQPHPDASHVSVISRTGYRWSFALRDARGLLLATHVGGEPISHDHGAPARLVVPGARGFQWIKWVDRVELRDSPDYTAPASTIWSSFGRTGSGQA